MSHTVSCICPASHTVTHTGCTWFSHARTHPRDSPSVSPAFLSPASSGTHSCTLLSLSHFLSSWAWQGAQEAINSLGNLQAGAAGIPGREDSPAHSLLRDPIPSRVLPRYSPSPSGSPRLAPHQEEGKVRTRPWGQSGGHWRSRADLCSSSDQGSSCHVPRAAPRRSERPGSSRPPLGLSSFFGLHVGRRGGDLQATSTESCRI